MRDSPFHHYCQKCKRDFVNREALSQVWRFWYYRVPVQLIVQSITGAHASMKTVTVINVISSLTTRMIWTRWGTILIFRGWLTSIDSISEIPKNIHIAVVVRKSLTMTTTWRRWIIYSKDGPLPCWLGRWKHYLNSSAHEDCVCHKCDIGFEDEDELEEVSVCHSWQPTLISGLQHNKEEHSYCHQCERTFGDDSALKQVNSNQLHTVVASMNLLLKALSRLSQAC